VINGLDRILATGLYVYRVGNWYTHAQLVPLVPLVLFRAPALHACADR